VFTSGREVLVRLSGKYRAAPKKSPLTAEEKAALKLSELVEGSEETEQAFAEKK
jgi:hypothetical protein